MAYNYLGLTNEVLHMFNEVPLTSATFATANDGSYQAIKDGVNKAIRDINQFDFEWPFNFIEQEDILSAGTMRYPYPWNAKSIKFDSFRIRRNNTFGNRTTKLKELDYEEYLDRYIDDEYNTSDTSIRQLPHRIARAPGQEYIVYPCPNYAYELIYEYYSLPTDLILYTDVPTIPEAFKHIIRTGASIGAYMFRSDYENADRARQDFETGIENMRKVYINRYEYVRDTRVFKYPVTTALRIS